MVTRLPLHAELKMNSQRFGALSFALGFLLIAGTLTIMYAWIMSVSRDDGSGNSVHGCIYCLARDQKQEI
jgi:hypothetical protein